jgi:ketosteroid isomerase-like protein
VSEQNVAIVREAFATEGPLTSAKQIAPDAEFDFTSLYLDRPVIRGVQEMRQFRDAGPWGRSISFHAERFLDVDDERVLVFVRATAAGQRSGTPVESLIAHECTVRDGLIVRVKVHPDRAAALEATGLSERPA